MKNCYATTQKRYPSSMFFARIRTLSPSVRRSKFFVKKLHITYRMFVVMNDPLRAARLRGRYSLFYSRSNVYLLRIF